MPVDTDGHVSTLVALVTLWYWKAVPGGVAVGFIETTNDENDGVPVINAVPILAAPEVESR